MKLPWKMPWKAREEEGRAKAQQARKGYEQTLRDTEPLQRAAELRRERQRNGWTEAMIDIFGRAQ
jgi:hypothetical protein